MKHFFIGIVVFTFFKTNAQEVESITYQFMLNTLLSHSVPELSVSQVDSTENVQWLDARDKKEYQISKIAGAEWVGYEDFTLERVKHIPKDEKIIIYCSVGYRSEKVAEKLKKAGYTNVHNLFGGIFEWKNEGKMVVDSLNNETEKVHAFSRTWGIWLHKGEKVY